MKTESAVFVERGRVMLARADVMLGAGLNEDAARCAYMACFHVAQAYIYERSGRVSKSHRGVQIEFFRLSRDDLLVDPEFGQFFSQAYEFKTVADYSVGPDAVTSSEDAAGAITMARRFVSEIAIAV